MRLLLGTNNSGKVIEMGEALGSLVTEILTPSLLSIVDSPDETGTTFAENAKIKSRFYHERGALPTLADDSGILVDALAGELGIHTRRWGAGPDASDAEWIEYFWAA
jgi:XTP/dITP diphosphohydrolase